jgi:uncharacterized repeat protein (TIGR01451 family)
MNTSKLLLLGVLMLSLAVTGSAFGLDAKVSCGNTAYFVSNDEMALCVFPGDEIYYIVSVGLGANDYPIINGEVTFTTPDGVSYTLATGLSLNTGDTVYFDVRVYADGWENYIVNCGDGLSVSECSADSVLTTGTVPVTGTGTWQLYCKEPCIDVTKTPDTELSKIGDTVYYEICVTNCSTGNEALCDLTLTNVQVEDTLLGPITFDPPISELAVGESRCVTVSREVQEGDPDPLVNTVTASGEMYDPGAVDTPVVVTDEDSASVNLFQPCLEVTKECTPTASVGGNVHYTITLNNCSSVDTPPMNVIAIDTLLGTVFEEVLPLGQTVIELDRTLLDTDPCPLVNTVTAIGTFDDYPNILEPEPATCETLCENPGTTVDIKANDSDGPITVCEGEQVTLTICEENTGDVPLTNVYVELYINDNDLPDQTLDCPDLEPGEQCCSDVPVIVDTPTVYSVVGYGTDPAGNVITIPDYETEYDDVEVLTEPCGGEGCTPGFWKENAEKWNHSAWVGHLPTDLFSTVFGRIIEVRTGGNKSNTVTNPNLLQALNANGGQINALARHATAALLNISSGCINYGIGEAELISLVQQAIDEEDWSVAGYLDDLNNAGCPISQHQQGDCIDGD